MFSLIWTIISINIVVTLHVILFPCLKCWSKEMHIDFLWSNYSPGCYLDEWPVRALSQVDGCTWTSDCPAPGQVPSPTVHLIKCHPISKVCQFSIFSERHLRKWHMPALSQVIPQTELGSPVLVIASPNVTYLLQGGHKKSWIKCALLLISIVHFEP